VRRPDPVGRYAEADKSSRRGDLGHRAAACRTPPRLRPPPIPRRQARGYQRRRTSMVDLPGARWGEDIALETRLHPVCWPAMTDAIKWMNALLTCHQRPRCDAGSRQADDHEDGVALDLIDVADRGGGLHRPAGRIRGKAWRRRSWSAGLRALLYDQAARPGDRLGLSMIYGFAQAGGRPCADHLEPGRAPRFILHARARVARAEGSRRPMPARRCRRRGDASGRGGRFLGPGAGHGFPHGPGLRGIEAHDGASALRCSSSGGSICW